MMQEVTPKDTTRAYAFEMWMNAPMPMVTLIKTLDVTRLRRFSRKRGLKFNMLMCWCIGRAATQVKEFYMLPVGDKLIRYDSIAVNTIQQSLHDMGRIPPQVVQDDPRGIISVPSHPDVWCPCSPLS